MRARLSIVLAVVLVALAGTAARAQLVLLGISEMGNAGTNVQTIITNNMAAALEEKRLESFMKQLAALRIDGGREVPAAGWEAPNGGHHRSGAHSLQCPGGEQERQRVRPPTKS